MKELLTREEFEKEKEESTVLVIDFFTTWCGPCKMQAPILEEISSENEKKEDGREKNDGEKKPVVIAKIDCDKVSSVADDLDIKSVPTIAIFRDGTEFTRWTGLHNKEWTSNRIKDAIDGKKPEDMKKPEKTPAKKKKK